MGDDTDVRLDCETEASNRAGADGMSRSCEQSESKVMRYWSSWGSHLLGASQLNALQVSCLELSNV